MTSIAIKVSNPKAVPLRAHQYDAGADLFSSETAIIYPGEMRMIDTGVAVAIPSGYVGLVFSRSGQGKLRIHLANSVGVVDSEYRGNIKVIVVNEGDDPYEINEYATRIAQLVVVPILLPQFTVVDSWDTTARGQNGFGSTN